MTMKCEPRAKSLRGCQFELEVLGGLPNLPGALSFGESSHFRGLIKQVQTSRNGLLLTLGDVAAFDSRERKWRPQKGESRLELTDAQTQSAWSDGSRVATFTVPDVLRLECFERDFAFPDAPSDHPDLADWISMQSSRKHE